jgi:hypothetical protein
VFLGKIRQWSGLAQWNPKLENVSQDIQFVVRNDSSGTTSVFTSALSSFSAEWKNKTGSSGLPKWPVAASKHEGNAGVAIGIRVTPYSIGYLNVADAKTYGVAYAKIANAEGRYIAPTLEAVQAATNAFGPKLEALVKNGSTNFYVDAVDPKGEPEAYPISTFTYLIFDAGRMDCETMLDVLFFVYWAWTDANAAKMATEQLFSPITTGVRAILLSALAKLKCEGESSMGMVQLAFRLGCKPGATRPPYCSRGPLGRMLVLSCNNARSLLIVPQDGSPVSTAAESLSATPASPGTTPMSLRLQPASPVSQVPFKTVA